MSSHGVIVELAGISGSGKTFLMRALCRMLRQKGITSRTIDDVNLTEKLVAALSNIGLLWKSVVWVLQAQPRSIPLFLGAAWSWWTMQLKIIYCSDKAGIHLIDEGLIHKFRKVRRCSKQTDLLLRDIWGGGFQVSDLLIVVRANTETLFNRLNARMGMKAGRIKGIERAQRRVEFTMKDAEFLKKKDESFDFIIVSNSRDDNFQEEMERAIHFVLNRYCEAG